jgi:hypothetical protein
MNLSLTADHYTEWCQCFNRYIVGKNTKVSEEKYEAFWEQLKDVPFQAVVQACEELKGTPGPFIADPGTWKTMAVAIAAEMKEEVAAEAAERLTAPIHVEREEKERIRQARDEYVEKLEEVLGHPLSPTNVLKQEIRLPKGYACLRCKDTGWEQILPTVEDVRNYGPSGGQPRVQRCSCFYNNPTLVAHWARYEARRTDNKRSAIK